MPNVAEEREQELTDPDVSSGFLRLQRQKALQASCNFPSSSNKSKGKKNN